MYTRCTDNTVILLIYFFTNKVMSDPAHRGYPMTNILCYLIYLSNWLSCVNVNHIPSNTQLESKMGEQHGHVSCWQRFVLPSTVSDDP